MREGSRLQRLIWRRWKKNDQLQGATSSLKHSKMYTYLGLQDECNLVAIPTWIIQHNSAQNSNLNSGLSHKLFCTVVPNGWYRYNVSNICLFKIYVTYSKRRQKMIPEATKWYGKNCHRWHWDPVYVLNGRFSC